LSEAVPWELSVDCVSFSFFTDTNAAQLLGGPLHPVARLPTTSTLSSKATPKTPGPFFALSSGPTLTPPSG
jgi:hypothetical protein